MVKLVTEVVDALTENSDEELENIQEKIVRLEEKLAATIDFEDAVNSDAADSVEIVGAILNLIYNEFINGKITIKNQGNVMRDAAGNPIEEPLWELIGGAWYTFGADGYVKSGFVFDPSINGRFYVDINSGMKTGWQKIDGNWYYFNTTADKTRGIMYVNRVTPDGYQVNAEGIWVES